MPTSDDPRRRPDLLGRSPLEVLEDELATVRGELARPFADTVEGAERRNRLVARELELEQLRAHQDLAGRSPLEQLGEATRIADEKIRREVDELADRHGVDRDVAQDLAAERLDAAIAAQGEVQAADLTRERRLLVLEDELADVRRELDRPFADTVEDAERRNRLVARALELEQALAAPAPAEGPLADRARERRRRILEAMLEPMTPADLRDSAVALAAIGEALESLELEDGRLWVHRNTLERWARYVRDLLALVGEPESREQARTYWSVREAVLDEIVRRLEESGDVDRDAVELDPSLEGMLARLEREVLEQRERGAGLERQGDDLARRLGRLGAEAEPILDQLRDGLARLVRSYAGADTGPATALQQAERDLRALIEGAA